MCKDPALSYLNDFGYNVVRLPRADIRPLDLVGRHRGHVERIGRLDQLISPSKKPQPQVRWNSQVSGLEGQLSDQLDFSFAAKIVAAFVQGLGGNPAVSSKLSQLTKLRIQLSDVKSDRAEPAAIGQLLDGATLETSNPLWAPYLSGAGKLFVIFETLKSSSLKLQVDEAHSASASIDLPVLREVAGANVHVEMKSESGLGLTFSGTQQLVFGFKCLEISLSDGFIELQLAPPSVRAAMGVGSPPVLRGEVPKASGDEDGAALLHRDELLDFAD